MYSDLLPMVRTKEEVDLLVQEVEYLEEAVFKTDAEEWSKTMAKRVRLVVAEVLSANLPQDREGRKTALREIKKEIIALPVVNLVLAIDPTEDMVKEISDKLRKITNAGIIIDIKRDSLIVGGALVTYAGKFGDFSLATKIEKAWAKNAETLAKIAYGSN